MSQRRSLPALLGLMALVLAAGQVAVMPQGMVLLADALHDVAAAMPGMPCDHCPAGQPVQADHGCADHASCSVPAVLPAAPALPAGARGALPFAPVLTGMGDRRSPEPRPPRAVA